MNTKFEKTKNIDYTNRLDGLQNKTWKKALDVQKIYRRNLSRLNPGKTLDIGCGIGRYAKVLAKGSVGIDHNKYSVKYANDSGFRAFVPEDFTKSKYSVSRSFDTLLLSHVLEHMSKKDSIEAVKMYSNLLKKDGKVIIFCPQEAGYKSDKTHVTFLDSMAIKNILAKAGFNTVVKDSSFPFPRKFGTVFRYNEFVVVVKK